MIFLNDLCKKDHLLHFQAMIFINVVGTGSAGLTGNRTPSGLDDTQNQEPVKNRPKQTSN